MSDLRGTPIAAISVRTVYELIKRGELEELRVNGRLYLTKKAILAFLSRVNSA